MQDSLLAVISAATKIAVSTGLLWVGDMGPSDVFNTLTGVSLFDLNRRHKMFAAPHYVNCSFLALR